MYCFRPTSKVSKANFKTLTWRPRNYLQYASVRAGAVTYPTNKIRTECQHFAELLCSRHLLGLENQQTLITADTYYVDGTGAESSFAGGLDFDTFT
eukprot:24144-Eustigmatos_ZCMA.PRE.1